MWLRHDHPHEKRLVQRGVKGCVGVFGSEKLER